MYPAGAAPKADNWTTGHIPEGGRSLPQGRRSLRHRSRRDHRQRRHRRRDLPRRSAPQLVDAKGNLTVKTDAVRQALEYYKKLMAFLPPDVAGLGRRLQQQMAGFRQGRADHEPAERLGGRQARRAAGRRAVLDPRLPGRTEGPFRAVPALLLEHLEVLQEQGGGQEPAGASVASRPPSRRWSTASGGYDLPAFEKLTTLKIWAEEGPPKGTLYHYPNPYKHQTLSIAASPAPPKIAQQIYTQATLTKMCVRYLPGRSDGEDAGLGRRRVRRLHAKLRVRIAAAARGSRAAAASPACPATIGQPAIRRLPEHP